MPDHPHKGHRQRMRNRFLKSSLESFEPHEVLEMLLTYCIPLRNVNPLAHSIIDRFGSVLGAMKADIEELVSVKGVGIASAEYIKLLLLLTESYTYIKYGEKEWLLTLVGMSDYCYSLFENKQASNVMLIGLNIRGELLGKWPVIPDFGGTRRKRRSDDELAIGYKRAIANLSMQTSSYSVVITVYRAGSSALITDADAEFAREVMRIIKPLGTQLLDMIIVGNDGSCSAAGLGLLSHDCDEPIFIAQYMSDAQDMVKEMPIISSMPSITLSEAADFDTAGK